MTQLQMTAIILFKLFDITILILNYQVLDSNPWKSDPGGLEAS